MKPIKEEILVPIYDVTLFVVIDEEAHKRRAEMAHEFGPPPTWAWAALCSYNNKNATVALFFYPGLMTRGNIAHEIFHATSHIMARSGVQFDADNHEPFAYLCGWLTEQVYAIRDSKTP